MQNTEYTVYWHYINTYIYLCKHKGDRASQAYSVSNEVLLA